MWGPAEWRVLSVLIVCPSLQVLADVKKVITDEDLLGLVSDNMDTADAAGWEVIDLHVSLLGLVSACTQGRQLDIEKLGSPRPRLAVH
jgi:hypothetical protein